MTFVTFYLEVEALVLYLEMDEFGEADGNQIENKLIEVFAKEEFMAYRILGRKRWSKE